ncbi:MAG TPA: hypothetical protein PLZ27_06915 [Bacillota bacterium]|nr:hypothetical protein [Clostridiales bacterium]HOQ14518.1 hypothetical protein [Bacillota bacterium]HPU18384.1 hypothetical protein [Bacillota bacterium]
MTEKYNYHILLYTIIKIKYSNLSKGDDRGGVGEVYAAKRADDGERSDGEVAEGRPESCGAGAPT